jgi:putative ABC transport system permease protein
VRLPIFLRTLGRTPGFTIAAVITIAVGVAATSAMFAVVYAVLLRPLPYPAADRLVVAYETLKLDPVLRVDPDIAARLAQRSMVMSRVLPIWRRDNHVFDDIGGYAPYQFSLTGTAEPERVSGIVATASLLRVLGVRPGAGREFLESEDQPGNDDVVLLSDALWERRFGRDPGALGRTIAIDGVPHTIVGVLPRGFALVLPDAPRSPALITPSPHAFSSDRKWALLKTVARLRPGATLDAARADLASIAKRLAETEPRNRDRGTSVFPLASEMSRDSTEILVVLLAATGCVLLIAAVNVASLVLVRAGARQRDLAIQAALGASRLRLAGAAAVEGFVLAAGGGVAGLVLAGWMTTAIVALMPPGLFPRMEEIALDLPVAAFGLAVAAVIGATASAVPMWWTRRTDRREALSLPLKASAGAVTSRAGRSVAGRALVALEIAIATVVLVAAVLLTATYVRLTRVDLGVRPDRVLTFELALPNARYAGDQQRIAFVDALLQRLGGVSGIEAAGVTSSLPVQSSFTASMSGVAVEGQPPSEAGAILQLRMVTPGVFPAAGIRLLRGRLLGAQDALTDAVVVNQAMVRRYWPSRAEDGQAALGRRVRIGKRWRTIIGVVDDVKYDGPEGRVEPEAYVPYAYWAVEHISIVIRAAHDPISLVPAARDAIRSLDPDLPLDAVRTLDAVLTETIGPPLFRSALMGSFALLALVLAIVGVYGVVSQSVAQRRRDIGIRMALGAAQGRIARTVVAESLAVAAVGISTGTAAAVAASRLLARFLYGASGADTGTCAAVAAAIMLVTLLASYGPARRAAKTDPLIVLRAD